MLEQAVSEAFEGQEPRTFAVYRLRSSWRGASPSDAPITAWQYQGDAIHVTARAAFEQVAQGTPGHYRVVEKEAA